MGRKGQKGNPTIVAAIIAAGATIVAAVIAVSVPSLFHLAPPKKTDHVIPTTTWTDAATGLTWAGEDNGSNVDWNEAKNFCTNLKIAEYSSGWHLPTISELASLYDSSSAGSYIYEGGPNSGNFKDGSLYPIHIKNGVKLDSCCAWSGERDGIANAWYYRFQLGQKWSFPINQKGGVVRALCVNGP
jgi:hypothetical protein